MGQFTQEVLNQPQGSLDTGSNLDIDTSAEQITAGTSYPATVGVLFRADSDNSGVVYLGNSDVTAGTSASTDGLPLSAGDAVFLQISNANLVYAIGSAINQKIYFMVV
jgi:hypothetical protein